MVEGDYRCPRCERVAERGFRVRVLGLGGHSLQLHCPAVDHEPWTIPSGCPDCGGVPEYRKLWDGGTRVPGLHCCGGLWTPAGAVGNPFLDEIEI